MIVNILIKTFYLSHHPHERPSLEGFQGHANEVLVEEGADEEHGNRGGILRVPHLYDRNVKMPAINPAKTSCISSNELACKLRVALAERIELLRLVSTGNSQQ